MHQHRKLKIRAWIKFGSYQFHIFGSIRSEDICLLVNLFQMYAKITNDSAVDNLKDVLNRVKSDKILKRLMHAF